MIHGLFQSTRPCGARPAALAQAKRQHHVSIHAPVWGATRAYTIGWHTRSVSIHAPVWGATAKQASR